MLTRSTLIKMVPQGVIFTLSEPSQKCPKEILPRLLRILTVWWLRFSSFLWGTSMGCSEWLPFLNKTPPVSWTLILTVDHLPLVPSLHFDLIQDYPTTLDIIYAFEPQWAVLGRDTQDLIPFCCQDGGMHPVGWAMADLVIILYSNSLLLTADLRFVLQSALTCFVLLSPQEDIYLEPPAPLHSPTLPNCPTRATT